MQGLTTELVNAVFMATKLAGDIDVYDYRVREFEKILIPVGIDVVL